MERSLGRFTPGPDLHENPVKGSGNGEKFRDSLEARPQTASWTETGTDRVLRLPRFRLVGKSSEYV
jgi:hypothetical protein